jgi:mono/diheme cytochrome c family protein
LRNILWWEFLLAARLFGQQDSFANRVYPVLEKAQCRICHNDNGVASATRLQFPPEKSTAAAINRFGLRLKVLVDTAHPEQSLLLRKPTNAVPHSGGERIRPGSEEEKQLRAWVVKLAASGTTMDAASAESTRPAAAELRRLTHSQYNHTVQDLLGDQTRPADQFPKEDYVNGFTNQAEAQSISPLQAEAYNHAAEKLARNAFRGGDSRGLIPCKPAGIDDAGCRGMFIRKFGQRSYRRPLSESEVRVYDTLFRSEAARTHDFTGGAQVVVEAMLQSPHFLFHLEGGPDGRLKQFRAASALSYFLWDTMPDEALFRAAENGELAGAAAIESSARRLLSDDRARSSFDVFLAQWLRFDRLHNAVRDRRLYPEFGTELVSSMIEEVRRLFGKLVWENGSFLDFFKADTAFLNSDLARLYGVQAPAQEFATVKFPADSGRAGVLGSAMFLALTSKPSDSSPTERGLFVREHFLCQIVPPPPPGVNTNLPPPTDGKPMSNREQLGMHLSSPNCAACHRLIDPIGFGFENYDAIGRYRTKQKVTIFPTIDEIKTKAKVKPTTYELPIEATGSVRGIPNSDFKSPRELGAILAESPVCQKCVVKQLFRYAIGRPETAEDDEAINASLKDFRDSQFRFQNLIISVIKSQAFLGGPRE